MSILVNSGRSIGANFDLRRVRPQIFFPTIITAWSLTCLCQGFAQSTGGLAGARFVLGAIEAPIFPAIGFYLSQWYRRDELALRYAIFLAAAAASGAFGGILAYGIGHLDGARGYSGWRWIFIIEGSISCVFGIATFFLVKDWPARTKFLTEPERFNVLRRIAQDQVFVRHRFNKKDALDAVLDWKVWAMTIVYLGSNCSTYAIGSFMPSIIKDLGYSNADAQLLTIPPIRGCYYLHNCTLSDIRLYEAKGLVHNGRLWLFGDRLHYAPLKQNCKAMLAYFKFSTNVVK